MHPKGKHTKWEIKELQNMANLVPLSILIVVKGGVGSNQISAGPSLGGLASYFSRIQHKLSPALGNKNTWLFSGKHRDLG